jgi:hypothetical protein
MDASRKRKSNALSTDDGATKRIKLVVRVPLFTRRIPWPATRFYNAREGAMPWCVVSVFSRWCWKVW